MRQISIPARVKAKMVPNSWAKLIEHVLADAAGAWGVSQKVILAMWAVPFILGLAGIGAALISKTLYKWLTDEDKIAENLQVLLYVLALALSIVIMRHLWNAGHREIAFLYLGLNLGLVFLIGEEISWGQRILGWATPSELAVINKQEETNIHNLIGVATAFKWVQFLAGAYGTILPLVVLRSKRLARYGELISRVVPHYTLVPFFLPMFIWKAFRNLTEVPERYRFAAEQYNEIIELILAAGILLFMVFQLRKTRVKRDAQALPRSSLSRSALI